MDMRKYSNIIITDDNEDEESEKLADQNGFKYSQYIGFEKHLTEDFSEQENKNGYMEWVSQRTLPNHSIDCAAPIIECILAYEFGNGFMLFGYRDSMYD